MSLMLINPRKRRTARKGRSVAQKAATRRMIASRSAPRSSKRRAAKRRSNPIGLPRVHHVARRRSARRHNPISLKMGSIGDLMLTGLKGAVGSVAINAAVNFLPAAVKTGKVLYVTRAALAIVLGTVGSKIAGKHARAMAEGALAVNFADLINSLGAAVLPGSQLHGVGGEYMGEFLSATHVPQSLPYASSGFPGTPADFGHEMNGVGEYMSPDFR
jgi:hypothetical protein